MKILASFQVLHKDTTATGHGFYSIPTLTERDLTKLCDELKLELCSYGGSHHRCSTEDISLVFTSVTKLDE